MESMGQRLDKVEKNPSPSQVVIQKEMIKPSTSAAGASRVDELQHTSSDPSDQWKLTNVKMIKEVMKENQDYKQEVPTFNGELREYHA